MHASSRFLILRGTLAGGLQLPNIIPAGKTATGEQIYRVRVVPPFEDAVKAVDELLDDEP